MPSTSAIASSLGQAAAQALRAILAGSLRVWAGPSSSWSRPCSAWSVAMASHLLPQPVGELRRDIRDLRRVDPARAGPGQVDLIDDAAGAAAQHDHPIAEPGRLADVVGDEQNGQGP